jgi:predicted RNase H-like nuclease (RuvC/YqgF family)
VINTRSPAKQNDPSEADYWRRRAKELEADILGLNEEVMFLNRKLEKLDELEEKIEVLLAQNSHLVDENESLIRLIQQKKSDAEMWKARFEGEHSNANLAEVEKKKIFDHLNIKDQEHQVQVDKLLA